MRATVRDERARTPVPSSVTDCSPKRDTCSIPTRPPATRVNGLSARAQVHEQVRAPQLRLRPVPATAGRASRSTRPSGPGRARSAGRPARGRIGQLIAEGPQGLAPLAGGKPVEEKVPVEVIELVLQAAGQQPGALDPHRPSVQVHPGGHRVPGPRRRQVEAGYRQACFRAVLVPFAGHQAWVDQVSLLAVQVVAEHAQVHADLGGGEPGPAR